MIRKLIVIAGNIGIVVAIFLAMQIMGSMRPEPERKVVEPKLPAAFVQEVEFQPLALTVRAQGEVTPRREIALTPQVSGRITFVSDKFVDGGIIEAGDVLVRIEDSDYRSALTRARARVASARQALEVEKAESALALRDFQELSGSQGEASALTLRQPQLARAEADYNAARADLADAEIAVSRTEIRAPFDGRVRSISANFGQSVGPGTRIGELFATDVAEVRLPLSDSDLARLQLPFAFSAEYGKGPKVHFSAIAAGQERKWVGSLVRVAAAIDPTTRQISAIAQVQDPYGDGSDDGFPMAIGLFANAEIQGPMIERAVVLPRLAIQNENTVYILDSEDTVSVRSVAVAATSAQGVIVVGGLEDGERVVVSRMQATVGDKVRPLDPSNPTASTESNQSAQAASSDTEQGAQ